MSFVNAPCGGEQRESRANKVTHPSCPNGTWVPAIKVKCDQNQIHTIECCSSCFLTPSGDAIDARFRFLLGRGKKPNWHPDFRKLASTNEQLGELLRPFIGKTRVDTAPQMTA